MLRTQMRQRPANLRRARAFDLAAGLGRVEIMAAPRFVGMPNASKRGTVTIRVEAQRQAMLAEYLQQCPERARNVEAVPSSGSKNAE